MKISKFWLNFFLFLLFPTLLPSTLAQCPYPQVSISPKVLEGLTNKTINISVSAPANVSIFEIVLPKDFIFVENSNATNASNAFFEYSGQHLYWKNATPQSFLNTSAWFSFKVNLSQSLSGNFPLNLSFKYLYRHISCISNWTDASKGCDGNWNTYAYISSGIAVSYENYTLPYIQGITLKYRGAFDSQGTNMVEVYAFNFTSGEWQKIGQRSFSSGIWINNEKIEATLSEDFISNGLVMIEVYGNAQGELRYHESEISYTTGDLICGRIENLVVNPTWSSSKEFFMSPPSLLFNPFNGYSRSFIVGSNENITYPFFIHVDNITYETSKYGQRFLYQNYPSCFVKPQPQYPNGLNNLFLVKNSSSGEYTQEFKIGQTNSNISLEYTWLCPPGRYEGSLLIYNSSNQTENASLNFILDVPISTRNQISSYGNGTIYGRFEANSSPHVYYLITSPIHSMENLTSLTLKLESSEKNLDLFLFDSNDNLIAYSTNPQNQSEEIVYTFVPSDQTFKIKIFGNFSSGYEDYILKIAFSTLNFTDKGRNPISEIDFGKINLTDKKSVDFFIVNKGNLSLFSDLKFEVFREIRKTNLSPGNYSFLIPSHVKKISAKISWTGDSNYTLKLFSPNDNLVGESTNKHLNSRTFNISREEFIEIENEINDGRWRVEIINNSLDFNPYNLSIIYWFDESNWLVSNLTKFNLTSHSSIPIQVNLSIPYFAVGGEYKGFIIVSSDNSAKIKFPIKFNVTAGTLTVSDKFETLESKIVDNIGFNRTGSNTRNITLKLENVGNENLTISLKTSQTLNHSSNYAKFSTITLSKNQLKPSEIAYIYIPISINTSETNNQVGIYEGWVLLNYSTQNIFLSYNISIKLNLTDLLYVSIPVVKTEDGNQIVENASESENITIGVRAWYINETTFESEHQIPDLNEKNFSITLIHSNNTNYKFSFEGSDILEAKYVVPGYYAVKVTLPSNLLGGLYRVKGRVDHFINPHLYGENESSLYLTINNTGLKMELMNSSSITLYPGNSTILYLKVTNFGPLTSDPSVDKINFTENCAYYSVFPLDSTCEEGTTKNDNSKSFGIKLSGYSSCYVRWKISASSSGDNKYCTSYIYTSGRWFAPTSLSIDVKVKNTTRVGVAKGISPNYTTTQSYVNLEFIDFPTLILVEQNSSNTTYFKIKNTGNFQTNVNLKVEGINSSWFSILPSGFTIDPNEEVSIKLTIKVSNEKVNDYEGNLIALTDNKSFSRSFTLRILPGLELKKEINESYQNFTHLLKTFEEVVKSLKEKRIDTSAAEIKLELLKQKISELEHMISTGDYFHAYSLLPQVKNMIQSTQETLSSLQKIKPKKPKLFPYILLGAIIGIAIFLIYLFWPEKTGYDYRKRKFVWKSEKKLKFLR